MNNKIDLVKRLLRLGVALTFLGHGMFAFYVKPSWLVYLNTVGFSLSQAQMIMPYIGVLDFFVAAFALFRPYRGVILWALIWTFATACIRPLSGEPIWDFVERGANWICPLCLLYLQGFPKTWRDLGRT